MYLACPTHRRRAQSGFQEAGHKGQRDLRVRGAETRSGEGLDLANISQHVLHCAKQTVKRIPSPKAALPALAGV
jgi:hypothetical protein